MLGARRADRLQCLAHELTGRGGKALAVTTDVTHRDQLKSLVDAAVQAYGRIDVMLNNAAGASEAGTRAADAVDGHGVVVAAAAAAAAGVARCLLVSAFPDAWRDRRMPPEFEHSMKVKRQADVHVAATDLD